MNAGQRRKARRVLGYFDIRRQLIGPTYNRRMTMQEVQEAKASGRPFWGAQIGWDKDGPIILVADAATEKKGASQ